MASFSRSSFTDGQGMDLHDRVLKCVCERGRNAPGAQVRCGPMAEQLGIGADELFRTILSLVDYGFLAYVGAGPVVEITQLGSRRCAEVPLPSPE